MSVTVWGILSGILLLAIPIYVIYRFKLGMINRFLVSVCRMMLVVAGMGLLIFAAVKLDSIGFDMSALVIRKAGLKPVKLLVPVAGGMLLSTLVIGFYVLFFVLGQKNPFAPQLFLPVMGLIAFGMIRANARSLEVYYMGLKNHSQLYYYLLGNGSSHREAIDYLLRRSLQASLVSSLKQVSHIIMLSAPVLMFGMIIGGADAVTAAVCQFLFMIVLTVASTGMVFITLLLARRGCFD